MPAAKSRFHPIRHHAYVPVKRPSKLTEDVVNKLREAIRLGMPYTHAAAYAGIGAATLFKWINKGKEEPESEYGRFLMDLDQDAHQAEALWLAMIEKAARGVETDVVETTTDPEGNQVTKKYKKMLMYPQWSAAARKLEWRFPQVYGRQPLVQTNVQGENVQLNLYALSDEELAKKLEELEEGQ